MRGVTEVEGGGGGEEIEYNEAGFDKTLKKKSLADTTVTGVTRPRKGCMSKAEIEARSARSRGGRLNH